VADQASIEALRQELAQAGVQPLPDPPLVSHAQFELGRMLFFDKILSGNQDVSCATCHLPQFGTSDGRTLSDGVRGIGLGPHRGGGEIIPRNSPSLFALHLRENLFWDGRVQKVAGSGEAVSLPPAVPISDVELSVFTPGLELLGVQAMLPPVSREEMRGLPGENPLGDLGDGYNTPGGEPENTARVWGELLNRLMLTPRYPEMLQAAYPSSSPLIPPFFSFAQAANAIAAFEARAFARTDSPFERFVRGDDRALSGRQVAGGLAFFRAGCAACHSGSLLTDQGFHNTGMPQLGPGVIGTSFGAHPGSDVGRENATEIFLDRFKFRTPSLLNVALTGPWGHAGQFERLRDMVAHYQDPAASLLQYDIQSNVFDPALVTTLVPNAFEILQTLDPRLQGRNDFDVDAVVDFLGALTADSARDLSDLVPESVPSGLPVF
jgi:cytochrome c peroxidase